MSEKKASPIRRLFDGLWGVVIALYRLMIIASLVFFGFMLWTTFQGGRAPSVEDNLSLIIWPSGDLVEQSDGELRFIERLLREPPSQTTLRELIEALELGAEDDRISSAVLKLDTMERAGLAQMEELVAAVRQFQATGKPVHAYGPYFDQVSYLAASAADDVALDPEGVLLIEGFSAYQNYFKDALDKLGITVNVFRVGEFKAAVEPFIRNDMSEEAREANREWLSDLWAQYAESVAQGREVEPTAIETYVSGFREGMDRLDGNAAEYAQEHGLVTHLETLEEWRSRVGEMVGMDKEHGSFRQIHYQDYLRAQRPVQRRQSDPGFSGDEIALVVVQGEIVDGLGEDGQAGGDSISKLLRDARRDEHVAAVVLRVDSPGGSAWASEQIRREVQLLREAGKPVVASMGAVAASGGYWVSMDADQIWAHPSTITGSIGIFGLIPTVDQPLRKMGIHTDGVGTTSLAGSLRIDKPLSEDVRAIIQTQIERGYRNFIEGVANGRGLELAEVEKIAQGRVWSGADARSFGLIDAFGGLNQAAAAAAELAGLAEGQWQLEERREAPLFPGGIFGKFFGRLDLGFDGLSVRSPIIGAALAETRIPELLKRFSDPRGIYAHCMCGSIGGPAH